MSRRLSWLPQAYADLARLREFINVHNPAAAGRAAKRIREAVLKLPDHPLIGKSVDDIDDPRLLLAEVMHLLYEFRNAKIK